MIVHTETSKNSLKERFRFLQIGTKRPKINTPIEFSISRLKSPELRPTECKFCPSGTYKNVTISGVLNTDYEAKKTFESVKAEINNITLEMNLLDHSKSELEIQNIDENLSFCINDSSWKTNVGFPIFEKLNFGVIFGGAITNLIFDTIGAEIHILMFKDLKADLEVTYKKEFNFSMKFTHLLNTVVLKYEDKSWEINFSTSSFSITFKLSIDKLCELNSLEMHIDLSDIVNIRLPETINKRPLIGRIR